jgi:hypothetical protein
MAVSNAYIQKTKETILAGGLVYASEGDEGAAVSCGAGWAGQRPRTTGLGHSTSDLRGALGSRPGRVRGSATSETYVKD